MNREECIKIINEVLKPKIEYYNHESITAQAGSNYEKKMNNNRILLEEAKQFMEDTLDTGSCSNCSIGLVIVCEDCGKSLCRYCRCYDGNDELCNPCIENRLRKRRNNE